MGNKLDEDDWWHKRYRLVKARIAAWKSLAHLTITGRNLLLQAIHCRLYRTVVHAHHVRVCTSGPRVRACIGMVRSPKANFPIRFAKKYQFFQRMSEYGHQGAAPTNMDADQVVMRRLINELQRCVLEDGGASVASDLYTLYALDKNAPSWIFLTRKLL